MGNGRGTKTSYRVQHSMRWSRDQAVAILEEWRSSGQSIAAFARERGVVAQRLHWWRAQLRGQPAPREAAPGHKLVPAIITGTPLLAASVTVRTTTGEAVEVSEPSSVSPDWVAAVVVAISRASR